MGSNCLQKYQQKTLGDKELMGCSHYMDSYQSKEEGKDQEYIQSNTTPDPGHYMGK